MTQPKLLVGSDALGWQELGGKAIIGQMTKAMPGGDGSLEFALYGDDAWKARNVLVPGESEVRLVVGGEPVYGGVLVTDPVRHRLSCQSVVECAASGPYGLAARDGRYALITMDTDPEQWHKFSDQATHTGRFTYSDDGVLEIRAEDDRNYALWDWGVCYYLLHDGLITTQVHGMSTRVLAGIGFEYKLSLPSSNWMAAALSSNGYGGWDTECWSVTGSATVSSWTPVSTFVAAPLGGDPQTVAFVVQRIAGSTGPPSADAWLRVRKRRVSEIHGMYDPGDFPTLYSVIYGLGYQAGADVLRVDSALDSVDIDQFVSRFPTDLSETLRQALALYTGPVEAFFDLDPSTLTRRFTARPRPADTALAAENRLWVVGGRGGEDTDGLVRDWEATPDQVTVMYAVKDDAVLPDGTVQAVTYPGGTEPTWPLAEVVDITSDKPTMTETDAARYAQAVYEYRQSNRYSGDVSVMQTAHDERGSDVPTYKMRPGDRVTAKDRDDTDRFGETLYVQATSYDWSTGRGTMTVGSPFDPTESAFAGGTSVRSYNPGHALALGAPRRARPHFRTGIA